MKTAILIAAHNEEAVIGQTLVSIGKQADIFVASDNSTDLTASIARLYTPNVIEINRGGKGRAIKALIDMFDIINAYDAFIILDADTLVGSRTVKAFEQALIPGVAGAVGRIEAENDGLISYWRQIQHFTTSRVYRTGMAATNCINIMSGTCAIWRTEAFKHIEWNDTPTEDLDFTYQLHRKRLGRIAYASHAIVYTQEPLSLSDYVKQMVRWYRGYWASNAIYKVPFGRQSLDAGQAMFIFEATVNWARLIATLLVPFGLVTSLILVTYLYDLLIIGVLAILTSYKAKNPKVIGYLPLISIFTVLDPLLNLFSLMTYSKHKNGIWKSPNRMTEYVTKLPERI